MMVLRSDSKRFNEEIAAAGKDSQETVIDKWKSCVRERVEVSRCPIHHDPADPAFGSFLVL